MDYRDEALPITRFVKKSLGWLFALILGLLVCITDINFKAEADLLGAKQKAANIDMAELLPVQPAIQEPKLAELTAPVFEPGGELEPLPFDRIIHEAAGRYHVDADLISAIIMVESQFNPSAHSKRGAKGLMQLMPVTAEALDVDDIYSPEENVDAGVRHFSFLLERLDGNVKLALAAYNAGMQNVLRYDGMPPYPETRAYVNRVLNYYASIKDNSLEF